MSSQAKLDLRPPPNVEFIEGFPGIPSGPGRPQPAVRGEVELRVGQGPPLKAKLLTVELRKTETLPGGGPLNTYTEPVAGPLIVWQAKNEWELQQTTNYPFHIRIPETVAPSTNLEKAAGIRYEIVAKLSLKGKKGFLRKESATTLTQSAPVVIDKHELHSTWPIYLQPDIREAVGDGLTLVVERPYGCYAPGDTVVIKAALRSISPVPHNIGGYEFAFRETMIFRSSPPPGAGARQTGGTQVRNAIIGQQKIAVNMVMQNGMHHSAQLACLIPPTHTVTTVQWGKHIEVKYNIGVRVLFDNGKQLVLDNIQVIMSGWPRHISAEAIRRIGYAPNTCGPYTNHPSIIPQSPTSQPFQQLTTTASSLPQARPPRPYTIAEKVSQRSSSSDLTVSEFGYNRGSFQVSTTAGRLQHSDSMAATAGIAPAPSQTNGTSESSNSDEKSKIGQLRPPKGRGNGGANRFTIVNRDENESESPHPTGAPTYLSAEDEKRRLQESIASKEKMSTPAPVPVISNGDATSSELSSAEEDKRRAAEEKGLRDQASEQVRQTELLQQQVLLLQQQLQQQQQQQKQQQYVRQQEERLQEAKLAEERQRSSGLDTTDASGSQSKAAESQKTETSSRDKPPKPFLSAEEEKRMLAEQQRRYDEALEKARKTQERGRRQSAVASPTPRDRFDSFPPPLASGSQRRTDRSRDIRLPYLSADEEKRQLAEQMRLYDEASERAKQAREKALLSQSAVPAYSRDHSGSSPLSSISHLPQEQNVSSRSVEAEKNGLAEQGASYQQTLENVIRTQDRASSPQLRNTSTMPGLAVGLQAGPAPWLTQSEDVQTPGRLTQGSRASVLYPHGFQQIPMAPIPLGASQYVNPSPQRAVSPTSSVSGRGSPYFHPPQTISAGAALYSHAISSMKNRSPSASFSAAPSASTSRPPPSVKPETSQKSWLSAEEEKERLRFLEAKRAVERRQNSPPIPERYSPPIIPSNVHQPVPQQSLVSSLLSNPPYVYPSNSNYPTSTQSVLRSPSPRVMSPSDPQYTPSPPLPPPSLPSQFDPTLSEKDRMNYYYQMQDAAALQSVQSAIPSTSPPGYDEGPSHILPPPVNGNTRPLNAAEEKAMLKSQYEAEEAMQQSPLPLSPLDTQQQSNLSPPSTVYSPRSARTMLPTLQPTNPTPNDVPAEEKTTSPDVLVRDPSISWGKKKATSDEDDVTPPPLLPRPPPEYIQETQQQDALMSASPHDEDEDPFIEGLGPLPLEVRPMSPFSLTFVDEGYTLPPPLPPKVPLDE